VFGLMVRFTCKDEASAERFDRLVAELIERIEVEEPGTLVYAAHRVEGRPLQRIFYELYRDEAAFDAHEEQEHTRRFLDGRGELLASVDVDRLGLQGGKGMSA
jgi:quinol monooxygenase YgiN